MSDATRPAAPEPQQPQQQQQQVQQDIVLLDKGAPAAYSNFARVTATHEEVIIDFCLNPNPFYTGHQELPVAQRLIMNFYTAKRLFHTLAMTLQRHEQTFGPIELDLRRRLQAQPAVPPGQGMVNIPK
jgi:hypothetical protein